MDLLHKFSEQIGGMQSGSFPVLNTPMACIGNERAPLPDQLQIPAGKILKMGMNVAGKGLGLVTQWMMEKWENPEETLKHIASSIATGAICGLVGYGAMTGLEYLAKYMLERQRQKRRRNSRPRRPVRGVLEPYPPPAEPVIGLPPQQFILPPGLANVPYFALPPPPWNDLMGVRLTAYGDGHHIGNLK